jgi:hypothetical protein
MPRIRSKPQIKPTGNATQATVTILIKYSLVLFQKPVVPAPGTKLPALSLAPKLGRDRKTAEKKTTGTRFELVSHQSEPLSA